MAVIPGDINEIITRVDRRKDETLLPRVNAPKDRYDEALRRAFPDGQVVNTTEFDYGRSFRYMIVFSTDPDAAALGAKAIRRAVARGGLVFSMSVAISVLAPYYSVGFRRYGGQKEGRAEISSDEPLDSRQAEAVGRLSAVLGKGFHRIDPELAATVVPDVSTNLQDKGEATVADCLFFG